MRFLPAARGLAFVALVGATAPAAAFNCYAIVDRSNEVIYQDTLPPIDMSDAGNGQRDALRTRGQQLVSMDTDRCPAIDRGRLTGSGGPATVDEIVAGMRPAAPFGGSASTPAATGTDSGIRLPRITVPRATGGGVSVGGPVSGMSVR